MSYPPPPVSGTAKQPWWRSGWMIAGLTLPIVTIPIVWLLTALRKDWSRRRRWSTVGGTVAYLFVLVAVAPSKHPGSAGPAQNAAAAAPTAAAPTTAALVEASAATSPTTLAAPIPAAPAQTTAA